MLIRQNFLPNKNIATVYFGGGTPSLLTPEQLKHIITAAKTAFTISTDAEITIEVNPEDITPKMLKSLSLIGVNRISMGIQSFIDEELQLLGRRHSAHVAIKAVEAIKAEGFSNVSIDLIYGIPGSSLDSWNFSLHQAIQLGVEHISCYHLTVEKRTILSKKMERGELHEVDESMSVAQFNALRLAMQQAGFVHYEISNFAKDGFFSKHNSGYWNGVPYLGLGPSAHSYNGKVRQWNKSSLAQWEQGISNNIPCVEEEIIDTKTAFNELLLTRLRTIWGVNFAEVEHNFGNEYVDLLKKTSAPFIESGNMEITANGVLRILPEHYFTSDYILAELFAE